MPQLIYYGVMQWDRQQWAEAWNLDSTELAGPQDMKGLQVVPSPRNRCLPTSPLRMHGDACCPGLTRSCRTMVPGAAGAPATPGRGSIADLSTPTCPGEARQAVEHAPGSNLYSPLWGLGQACHHVMVSFPTCLLQSINVKIKEGQGCQDLGGPTAHSRLSAQPMV